MVPTAPKLSDDIMSTQETYKMIGEDGAEYGPVILQDFQQWVREGRVSGATHVLRSDQEAWTTAASFPELGVADRINGAPAIVGEPLTDSTETAELEAKIKSSASWFYWIAALTLINSVVAFMGSQWGFFLGFSVLQALDFGVSETSIAVRGAVLVFDVLVAAGFGALGIFAGRHYVWPFAIGVVLYGLDTALTLLAVFFGGSFIAAALHAWAIVSLIIGITTVIKLKKLQKQTIA